MDKEQLKGHISRPATWMSTGGFRPTQALTESWVSRVFVYRENEVIPLDKSGQPMSPLFQLCLEGLPFVPDIVKNTLFLTVFLSPELPMGVTPNGQNWLVREYGYDEPIMRKELHNPDSWFKPFPLKANLIAQDCPVWDGGGLASGDSDTIIALEDKGIISDYHHDFPNHYGHKLGGFPSFCQPGVSMGKGFEFVMQIATDEKANINIVDSGTVFLAKHPKTGDWNYYCDFY